MVQQLLLNLRQEFTDKLESLATMVPRQAAFPDLPKKIKVAMGMRRTGKTYFLYQTINDLLAGKIPIERILYLNFEDDRLFPLTQEKLVGLLDAFYSLFPDNYDHCCYLFLDEIQNAENWTLVTRRFFDSKNVQIYLTGSSAKLLSKEIATALRGRSFAIEIWPYSFHEYLSATQVALPGQQSSQKQLDKYKKILTDYLTQGGFPEIANLPFGERVRILQDYVDVVTFRDIVERYHVSNLSLIKYLISYLLKNTATSFSVNKFFNDIKSQGFHVSRATVYDYLDYIEDAYLAFTIPVYSESIRKQQVNPRKLYSIDPGLSTAYQMRLTKDYGRLFENLVFLDLKRQGHEVYYYLTKDRHEVDFLTRDISGKLALYQVVWENTEPKTQMREQRALAQAEQELGIKGSIITPESYLCS